MRICQTETALGGLRCTVGELVLVSAYSKIGQEEGAIPRRIIHLSLCGEKLVYFSTASLGKPRH